MPVALDEQRWVSDVNTSPEVAGGYRFAQPLTILDSTIRKVLYTTGFRPEVGDVMAIAAALHDAGVHDMILNLHYWGDRTPETLEWDVCRTLIGEHGGDGVTVFCDAMVPTSVYDERPRALPLEAVFESLRGIGIERVQFDFRDPRTESGRAAQHEQLHEIVTTGDAIGVKCVVGLSDIGRADFDHFAALADQASEAGVVRIDLIDPLNSLTPDATRYLVGRYRDRVDDALALTLHVHNDFGLATACALAGAASGARPDVAVNGVSYRAGFAALEEVVTALEVMYDVRTGIRLDALHDLGRVVAERSGIPIPPLKPITGAQQFTIDGPQWLVPLLRRGRDTTPAPSSCIAPSLVGASYRLVWTHHLSDSAIRAKLGELGLPEDASVVGAVRSELEGAVARLTEYPQWLEDEAMDELCRSVVNGRA
jgi:HMGL-like